MMTKKIRIKIEGREVIATIFESPAAEDFLSLLPLNLSLKDYASTEKIADLPKKLNIDGSPAGSTPHRGHIAYYAPWGNLAIFYKNFEYSKGLILLGKIDSDMNIFSNTESLDVVIESFQSEVSQ